MNDEPEIPQWELDYLNSDEYRRHMDEHAERGKRREAKRLCRGEAFERPAVGDQIVIEINGGRQTVVVTSEPTVGPDGTVTFNVAPEPVSSWLRNWLEPPPH